MARTIMTEKAKKKKRGKGFLVFLIVLICLGGLGYGGYRGYKYIKNKLNPKPVEVKEIDKVETKGYDYGYSLTEIDSKYYQDEFKKLKEVLTKEPVDEEAYATQLAKCFVIDLYTLSTKVNKYDVGGREFYYSDKQEDFGSAVMNSIYDKLIDNTYGDRKQDLPEVTDVKVNGTTKTTYMMGDKKVDGYLVKMNVTYKSVKADTQVSVVVVKEKDGKKMSVVDTQNTLNPKYNTK